MKWEMPIPALIVFIALIILGLIDFGFVIFTGTGGTISNWMMELGIRAPFLALCYGVRCWAPFLSDVASQIKRPRRIPYTEAP